VAYQTMLRAACAYALMEMLAGYDARNSRALNRLVAAGAQLVVLGPDILKALRTALEQVLDEDAAKASSSSVCSRTGAPFAMSSTAGS